jgi:O-acetyl-ADP-ribose deacetylase
MRMNVDQVSLQCLVGDISAQPDVDAVVNAANAQLLPGGGVAGSIHAAAGPALADACAPLAPIRPGDAVITEAFALPNSFVIHCLGPVFGRDEPSADLLKRCYSRALKLAEDNKINSIAFPAISTGAFGYPLESAAEIACKAVVQTAPDLRHVRLVRFVLYGQAAYKVFCSKLVRAAAALANEVSTANH